MGRMKKQTQGLSTLATASLVVIAVALLGLLVVGITSVFNPFGTDTVDRSAPVVLERIQELEQFVAAEGQFSETIDLAEDAKYLPSFLKGERVVAAVQGNVDASVDFGGLKEGAVRVSDDRRTIRLILPEPELQDAEIEESATKILTRDRGVIDRVEDFFSGNPRNDAQLFVVAEKKVNAAAAKSDLTTTAKDNTERWLRTFLGAAGFENVEISWSRSPR